MGSVTLTLYLTCTRSGRMSMVVEADLDSLLCPTAKSTQHIAGIQ